MQICYQMFLVKKFGCQEFYYPISLTNVTCPTLLDSFNASDYRKAYFDDSKNDEECTTSCREQCEYMKYETLVSNSLFPTETYSEILFKNGNISV
jgi:hypothetical protein